MLLDKISFEFFSALYGFQTSMSVRSMRHGVGLMEFVQTLWGLSDASVTRATMWPKMGKAVQVSVLVSEQDVSFFKTRTIFCKTSGPV